MRILFVVALLLTAVPALADPTPTTPIERESGRACLDPLGVRHGPVCHSMTASRLEVDPDICLCGAGYREVPAPWCEPGEIPAPDSAAADRARLAAAKATGTLYGASFEGRRFCLVRGRSGQN